MFKKQEILNDFKALFAGITIDSKAVPVIFSGTLLDTKAEYPAIELDITFINPAFLADRGLNTGFYSVDIEIACTTYNYDDKDRSVVNELLFLALEKINQTNILDLLNDISTYQDYIGAIAGDSFEADEAKLRHEVLQFTFKIATKPEVIEALFYYKFNEVVPGPVLDSSPNELNGVNSNCVINQPITDDIKSYLYNGDDAIVTVPKNPLLNVTTVMSGGGLVYLDDITSNFPAIYSKKSFFEEQYSFAFNAMTRKAVFRADNINTNWNNDANTAVPLLTVTWVGFTYDGANIRYYFNGQPDGIIAATGLFKSSGFIQEPDLIFGEWFGGFFYSGKEANVFGDTRVWTDAEMLAEGTKHL